jgi:branched-chain amino acid transport system substrate-binding protein
MLQRLIVLSVLMVGGCVYTPWMRMPNPRPVETRPLETRPVPVVPSRPIEQNTQNGIPTRDPFAEYQQGRDARIQGNVNMGWQNPAQPQSAHVNGQGGAAAILLPLSGTHAQLGKGMLDAANMAVADLRQQGFAIKAFDSGNTPQMAVNVAQKALAEGSNIILGPVFASSVEAVRGIASAKGVPLVAFSNDIRVAGQGSWLLGLAPHTEVKTMMGYAVSKGLTRIAAIIPQDDFGVLVEKNLYDSAQRYGADIVAIERFGASLEAMQQAVERLKQQKGAYQALLIPVAGGQLRTLANILAAADMGARDIQLLGLSRWEDPAIVGEEALQGAWFSGPPSRPRKQFTDRYAKLYGGKPSSLATLAYDGAALAAVMAERGRIDSYSLENPNGYMGLNGIFRFNAQGIAERGLAIFAIQGKKAVEIQPAPNSFVGVR